jgi:hypothetical protein
MGAEVYRWVDGNGVVNYSQNKPQGVAVQQIITRSGGPSIVSDASDPATAGTGELTAEQRRMRNELDAAENQRRQEMAQITQENCTLARDTLEKLTVRNRVTETDASGTKRVLPEEERQERIKQAQDAIVENCTS